MSFFFQIQTLFQSLCKYPFHPASLNKHEMNQRTNEIQQIRKMCSWVNLKKLNLNLNKINK